MVPKYDFLQLWDNKV